MLSSHKNLAELCEIIIHEDNAEQKLFIRYLLLEFSLLFRKWYDRFLFSIKFGQYSLYHLKWALVSDMFSLLTLHFYCFYIYSLRLYQLWIYGLGELLNLFRGLKYNPLKKRVDSVFEEFDTQRFILGAMIFSIFLFLFPTVLIFYLIFTMARLVCHFIQDCLHIIFSVVIIFLWFISYEISFASSIRNF